MSKGMGKIGQIYELSDREKFIKVKLKGEEIISCKADCFCTVEDEETGKDIPALLVIKDDESTEILTNNDIDIVEE